MKPPTDKLLDALVEDAASSEFRVAALNDMLGHARRRKRARHSALALIAVVLAAAAAVVWRPQPETPPVKMSSKPPVRPALIVVRTQPLGSGQMVSTRPGCISIIASYPGAFALVETKTSETVYARLSDQELFALLQGKPVALTRNGPNEAELIFLDPKDQDQVLVR